MYRPQNQSKFCESNFNDQTPFFREAIMIVDECTKLMKDDRIYLRNKVKDYLKQLRQNRAKQQEWQNEQMQLLIQIFVQANKKKSLSKIQKGDKVMDWLQIKLRKFVDNNKKQKHKKEVESFRRIKGLNPRKPNDSHIYFEKSLDKSREVSSYNAPKILDQISKLSFNLESKKKSNLSSKYSLGKSQEKSPHQSRKVSQNSSYSQKSLYRQFNYLRKESKSKQKEQNTQTSNSFIKSKGIPQFKQTLSQITKLNKSLETKKHLQKSFEKKIQNINSNKKKVQQKQLKNRFLQKQIESELSKQQIDKLTQLFSHHLNSQEPKKSNQNIAKETPFLFADRINKESSFKPIFPHKVESNDLKKQGQITKLSNDQHRYESSNNKIQEMLRNSKNILAEYEQHSQLPKFQPTYQMSHPQISSKLGGGDDLFTPPDFLAECRKFLFSSSKKRTEEDGKQFGQLEKNQDNKPSLFSDMLSEQKDKSQNKVGKLNQMNMNEIVSQNVSTNKTDSQVQFRLKNATLHNSEDLLKQIFRFSHKLVLDRYQINEIMNKCNIETSKLLQKYCDVLNLQSNIYRERLSFDFVATIKYFYTLGEIFQPQKEYYSIFLSEILDISRKEYVNSQDIDNFYDSLQSSQLESTVLQQIYQLLQIIYQKSLEIEGGNVVTYWSIYYLELMGSNELNKLKQHLNKFQFQVEHSQEN